MEEATNVTVLPSEPVTDAGLKLAVTPAGRSVMLNSIAPLNPPVTLTVTLPVAVAPCSTLTAEAEML